MPEGFWGFSFLKENNIGPFAFLRVQNSDPHFLQGVSYKKRMCVPSLFIYYAKNMPEGFWGFSFLKENNIGPFAFLRVQNSDPHFLQGVSYKKRMCVPSLFNKM